VYQFGLLRIFLEIGTPHRAGIHRRHLPAEPGGGQGEVAASGPKIQHLPWSVRGDQGTKYLKLLYGRVRLRESMSLRRDGRYGCLIFPPLSQRAFGLPSPLLFLPQLPYDALLDIVIRLRPSQEIMKTQHGMRILPDSKTILRGE
jgi:hypothetical protein